MKGQVQKYNNCSAHEFIRLARAYNNMIHAYTYIVYDYDGFSNNNNNRII